MNKPRLRQFLALFFSVVYAVQHNTADLCRILHQGSGASRNGCVCGYP